MDREKLKELQKSIYYSDKYYDEEFEYRHVVLPKELVKYVPKTHLMSEDEWRSIGVQQSTGWIHYMIHAPGEFKFTFPLEPTTFKRTGIQDLTQKIRFSDSQLQKGDLWVKSKTPVRFIVVAFRG